MITCVLCSMYTVVKTHLSMCRLLLITDKAMERTMPEEVY